MSQWGNTATQASNTPKWGQMLITAGSGKSNRSSNNTAMFQNSSPENFAKSGHNPFQSSGVFAASAAQLANTSGESRKIRAAGWQLREAGEGPIVSISVTGSSGNTANGEVILFTNGGAGLVNAYGVITTNSSGNMVSVVIGPAASFSNSIQGGRFTNSSVIATSFVREKHLLTISVTAAGSSGYTNGDIVQAGNGFSNGYGTITTNGSGNLASVAVGTNSSGLGLWPNNVANNVVTFSVPSPANGSATGGTFTANLITSAGGTVSVTLGGRAGRVQYECLVGMGSLTAANNTILPS